MQYTDKINLNAVDQCTIYFIRCLSPQMSIWTASGPSEVAPSLVVKCIAFHPVNTSVSKAIYVNN